MNYQYMWSEEDLKYLLDNHKLLHTKELADNLGVPERRVLAKIARLKLKTKRTIENEKINEGILRMIIFGRSSSEIKEKFNVHSDRIRRIKQAHEFTLKKNNAFKKEPIKIIEKVQHVEIQALKKLKLDNFEPKIKEVDERFRYRDLSPSEKLIYHGKTI